MAVTVITNKEIGDRLQTAFARVLPGSIRRLPTFAVPTGGMADSSCGWLCVDIEVGRRIRSQGWRGALIIAISRDECSEACLQLGPRDTLLFHDVSPARLVSAVRLAMAGLTIFPPGLMPRDRFAGPQLLGFERLSDDDRSVVAELALGLSNHEIATRLGRPVEMVRQSVDRIFRSLRCRNRTEVAVLAYSRLSSFLNLPEGMPPRAQPDA